MGRIIDTQTQAGTLQIILKAKRLDAASAGEFKQESKAAWSPAVNAVTIDLRAVDFVDSSGVGALLSLYKKLPPGQPSVRLMHLTPTVQSVIELLRLHRIFEIQA
jgi:anti-sigma B factor antagonist